MSDYLPEDLLAKILLRLPFNSLLRSRCVSKSWRALIDSPNFVKTHSKKFLDSNSLDNIQIIGLDNHKKLYTFNFDIDFNLFLSSIANTKQLNCPLEYNYDHNVHLVGSCMMNPNRDIVLWNPWIQKYWKLPPPSIQHSVSDEILFFLGFGYDQRHDYYKVLNLVSILTDYLSGEESDLYQDEVYLYSLKMNSWRRIDDFLSRLPLGSYTDCALASSALHWIVEDEQKNEKYVLAFDLSSEQFRAMPLPGNLEDDFGLYLKTVNGCLCLVSYSYFSGGSSPVDLWVMEDYGVDDVRLASF